MPARSNIRFLVFAQVATLICASFLISWICFGDLRSLLHFFTGQSYHCFARQGDVAVVRPSGSTSLLGEIELRNLSLTDVQIQGFSSECGTTVFYKTLPIVIKPGRVARFPVIGIKRDLNMFVTAFIDGHARAVSLSLEAAATSPIIGQEPAAAPPVESSSGVSGERNTWVDSSSILEVEAYESQEIK